MKYNGEIEVKHCPFCGEPANLKWSISLHEFVAGCVNTDCPCLEMPMTTIEKWNMRYGEVNNE